MRIRFVKKILSFLLVIGYNYSLVFCQDQALHYNGVNDFASFPAPTNLPSGNDTRTVEFWLRSDMKQTSPGYRQTILELGDDAGSRTSFQFFTKISGGQTILSFGGFNDSIVDLAVLPDDQWHHIAVVYHLSKIICYIDGEFSAAVNIGTQGLNTVTGTCYIGGLPSRNWYFQGAVDNLCIWSTGRNIDQIKKDMTMFPVFTGNEHKLVAYFKFDEGAGNSTFKDVKTNILGTVSSVNQWTVPIATNPDVISDGIWFVIQNKAEVDNDYAILANRRAVFATTSGVAMGNVPLTGDYHAFLWRTIPLGNGKYKLINKKLGMGYALDCSLSAPIIGNSGNNSSQTWSLSPTNKTKYGENAYMLTNDYITSSKAVNLVGNTLSVVNANTNAINQVWLFQPMHLATGYHISSPTAATVYPFTKVLALDKGQKLNAPNCVSDWAVLNSHNVINNMMWAFADTNAGPGVYSNKQFCIMSRYDIRAFDYPLITQGTNYQGVDYSRGYSGNITVFSEELLCKKGVYMRGIMDNIFREFDHIVHEFAHTLNYQYFAAMNIDQNPNNSFSNTSYAVEWFPWKVQDWFNSSGGIHRSNIPLNEQNYLATIFNANNTWLPPRMLRSTAPIRPTFLISGTLLLPGQTIYSPGSGNYILELKIDGNLIVKRADNGIACWNSQANMGSPMNNVQSVLYYKGILYFTTLTSTNGLDNLLLQIDNNQFAPQILFKKELHTQDLNKVYRLQLNNFPTIGGDYLQAFNIRGGMELLWNSKF